MATVGVCYALAYRWFGIVVATFAGLLLAVTAAPVSDPRRTPYEITESGAAAFDEWITAFDAVSSPAEDGISARALFVFELPLPVAATFFGAADDVFLLPTFTVEELMAIAASTSAMGRSSVSTRAQPTPGCGSSTIAPEAPARAASPRSVASPHRARIDSGMNWH